MRLIKFFLLKDKSWGESLLVICQIDVKGSSKEQEHVTTDQVNNMRNQNYHLVVVCFHAPVQYTSMSIQNHVK